MHHHDLVFNSCSFDHSVSKFCVFEVWHSRLTNFVFLKCGIRDILNQNLEIRDIFGKNPQIRDIFDVLISSARIQYIFWFVRYFCESTQFSANQIWENFTTWPEMTKISSILTKFLPFKIMTNQKWVNTTYYRNRKKFGSTTSNDLTEHDANRSKFPKSKLSSSKFLTSRIFLSWRKNSCICPKISKWMLLRLFHSLWKNK